MSRRSAIGGIDHHCIASQVGLTVCPPARARYPPTRGCQVFSSFDAKPNIPQVNVAVFSETVANHCHQVGRGVSLRIYGTVAPGARGNRSKKPAQNPDDFLGMVEWYPSATPRPGSYAPMVPPATPTMGGGPQSYEGVHPFHVKHFLQDPNVAINISDYDPDGSYYLEAHDPDQGIVAKTIVMLGNGSSRRDDAHEEDGLGGIAKKVQDVLLQRVMGEMDTVLSPQSHGQTGVRPPTVGTGMAPAPHAQGGPSGELVQMPDGSWVDHRWLTRNFAQTQEKYNELHRELRELRDGESKGSSLKEWVETAKELGPMVMPLIGSLLSRINPMFGQMGGMPGMGGFPGMGGMPGATGGGGGAPDLTQIAQQLGIPPQMLAQMAQSMMGGGSMPSPPQSQPSQPMRTSGGRAMPTGQAMRVGQASPGMEVMEQATAGTAQMPTTQTVGRGGGLFGAASIGDQASALAPDEYEDDDYDDGDESSDDGLSEEDARGIDKVTPIVCPMFETLYEMFDRGAGNGDDFEGLIAALEEEGRRIAPSLARNAGVSLFWLEQITKNSPDRAASWAVYAIRREFPGMLADAMTGMFQDTLERILSQVNWREA